VVRLLGAPLPPGGNAEPLPKLEQPLVASAPPARVEDGPPGRTDWLLWAGLLWLSGSLLWWGLVGLRVVRFRRLLRQMQPAPAALLDRSRRLAGLLGLRRCPGIWLVAAPVSPMLWSLDGRPRLLLPAALWERLNDDQRDTLLLHELAHLRRRDHWVRLVEVAAPRLYWWEPGAWWAPRAAPQAAAACFDA